MADFNEKGGIEQREDAEREPVAPIDFDDPHRGALEDNPEHAEKLSWRLILAIISLGLSYICPLSCGFILATAIVVQIGTELGDVTNITWIVGGWSVASSISFSIAGSLSDSFGRRYTVITGEVLSLIGSIIACTATTTLRVAAGSTVIGFGCGIIFVSYAGISELLPNKWRGAGIGFTEICMTLPWSFAGVLIATLLNSQTAARWRWCYYIGMIYGVISLAGTCAFYFPPQRPQFDFDKSRWQQIKEIDYLGCAFYTTGLTLFLVGVTSAGTVYAWTSARTLAPMLVGATLLALCFVYDFTLAKQPLFPLKLFSQIRDFTLLLVVVFVAGMVFYTMAALLPQGTLYMFTKDPIQIGITALPNGASQVLFGAVLTLFMGNIGHLKLQVIVLLVSQTLFTALLAVAVPDSRAAWMAFQFFAIGPFALITLVCYVIAGLDVPLRHLGLASGLIGTFRSAGGSVGNAIFNTILHGYVDSHLGPTIAEIGRASALSGDEIELLIPAAIQGNAGVPEAFAALPNLDPAVELAVTRAVKEVWAAGFRRVFYSSIPFGVVAIACACFITDPSIYLTNHRAVHRENDKRRDTTENQVD